ncbi:single-stranded DNA-binding protein [Paenibacillus sp. MBLB4367]|uniref:single-stranded DNA-binding protein n=1 Tax=Paenibacillus sp. MBLB4367 TaxID=3384767 RepID=UPI003907F3B6
MLNRVILIGRLVRDPELRYTPGGIATCTFTLAVDRPYTSDDRDKQADFIPIVVWRQQAEHCANYLRKGRLAAVEGRMQVRNYDHKKGHKVYVTEVIADNVRFLESAGSGQQREPQEQPNDRRSWGTDPFQDDGKPIDISDDDLPF